MPSPGRRLGLALSSSGQTLLQRLHQRGHLNELVERGGDSSAWFKTNWQPGVVLIVVGAVGAVTRLIAAQIRGKQHDPAVLVLDPQGRWCIPLLGGHSSGAEQLAREIATDLGGAAVLTGACSSERRLPLDCLGERWGWRRGGRVEAWRDLMQAQARGEQAAFSQSSGNRTWHQGCDQALLCDTTLPSTTDSAVQLSIGPQSAAPCRWHPASLWVGVGCERRTSRNLVERAIEESLRDAGLARDAVAGLASADRKKDEAALLQICRDQAWPMRTFSSEQLNNVSVPTPSQQVFAEMGTASVAEAAALLAAGNGSQLHQTKRIFHAEGEERGAVTVAIAEAKVPFAPQRGELHLIGSGPGDPSLLSFDARQALERCVAWVGYSLYLDLLEPLRSREQIRVEGQLTREWDRCAEALALAQQGARVALISSGDSGIYGMAGLAMELWLQQPPDQRPSFTVHPGISALQLAAARAGAPLMHDFCTISLSDRLTPWSVIERRLQAAAAGDFVVALYNPRSRDRDWQLGRARELLLEQRSESTPVVLARQLGRHNEQIQHTSLRDLQPSSVDMLTVILIGNSSTYSTDGHMVTPRGYPGATLN